MLKNTVPTSWIPVAHQSMRCGSNVSRRIRWLRLPERSRSAFAASRYWISAAEVKKTEPTKNTVPSAAEPTSWMNPGNGPTMKQTEPIANRTPIHQEARCGAHHFDPRSSARESNEACLRWKREDQTRRSPAASRYSTRVVNGPAARRSTTVQPSGVRG